jgi:tetratricopeptide (TPR) repeat protein
LFCRRLYPGIGLIFHQHGDLDKALEYFQRSLEIDLRRAQPNQVNIATHHINIGRVLDEQGKYDEALKSYERALEIELTHLPPRHPSL